jgi:hypothetical protein
VLRGYEVSAVEQDADGVTVGDIHGSYLVACDGGHSAVRKLLDVPFPGWKLAATVRGWAPEGLLDSYHAERHPVAARVLHNTRVQGVIANPTHDKDLAAVRDMFTDLLRLPEANRFISGLMSGLDVRYPELGPRMIDVDLTTQDGPTRVSRLMHSGRGLLAGRLHRLVRLRRATARNRPRPIVRLSALRFLPRRSFTRSGGAPVHRDIPGVVRCRCRQCHGAAERGWSGEDEQFEGAEVAGIDGLDHVAHRPGNMEDVIRGQSDRWTVLDADPTMPIEHHDELITLRVAPPPGVAW